MLLKCKYSIQVIIWPLWTTSIKIKETDNADEIFAAHEKDSCDPSKAQKEVKDKCIQCKKVRIGLLLCRCLAA